MKKFLILVATVALIGVGCAQQPIKPPNEPVTAPSENAEQVPIEVTEEAEVPRDNDNPIQYDLGDITALPERSLYLVRNLYTAEQLVTQSEECGTNINLEHFTEVLGQFKYQRVQRYDFLYRGESQEPSNYTLTVLDNGPNYLTLEEFKTDFDVCAAGSIMYPLELTENWLVFESGCGTGFDDGSGRPHGCELIREQIAKTLQVN